ncbi:hypothetical protein [Bradyrhizobium sp. 195]|uniref:hypothetical protein n=1 Tax=Bradyrhizobium sp. 195 TaxID=2782662 RepID=UPI002000FF75|nr:hypothetical protein [Bradyrhizobium sp. 195]UPK24734.1 hypothetical protein IVB26_25710 [Bradyrhizobium sp. 195]
MPATDILGVEGPPTGRPARLAWASRIVWLWIWLGAIGLALLVHLAFLVAWPDHFLHEDGGAYLDEAQSILTGHYLDDAGKRPYGMAIFLVLLSKLFGPHIIVFVIAQHLVSIGTALLIAATLRLAGVPRVLSVMAFLFAALYGRTVHYDNTIGAETISNFLISLAAFLAAGIIFRKWPAFLAAAGVGLTLGAVMTCRSAAVGQAAVILLWLAVVLDAGWLRRLTVLALAGGLATAVYLIPTAVNYAIGKRPAGNESLAVMAFVVGYSADFDHGVHLDRKANARALVEKMRSADTPTGWTDAGVYQWPFAAMHLLERPGDSAAEFEKVVRDIFIETLTTPSTLYRHVTAHFLREMYFLLFDANSTARRTVNPQGYEYFAQRDPLPFFGSPTGLKPGQLIHDHYKPHWRLERRVLPTPARVQLGLNYLLTLGYQPRPDLADLCCGLTISSEYDDLPGPIRWVSAATLILVVVLLAGIVAARLGWMRPLPAGLPAAGTLMISLALISVAFPAFLIYGFNRYAYYAVPFLAGASAILGAVALDQVNRSGVPGVLTSWARRKRPLARPQSPEAGLQP